MFQNLAILVIVSCLFWIQVPLDFRLRVLSRRASIVALVGILATRILVSLNEESLMSTVDDVVSTVTVTGAFGLLNKLSPQSLGWGDVLLVMPLSLAIGGDRPQDILWWQFIAATSAVVHVCLIRDRNYQQTIPFGPYLLLGAWLVLAARTIYS